jgi:hypothetical protein
MSSFRLLCVCVFSLVLAACRQPFAIEGEGDIVELNQGERGCALEEYEAGWSRCTENEIFESESLRYQALPRPGWKFSHWNGLCKESSVGNICEIDYVKDLINQFDEAYPDADWPPLTAVFVPDNNAPLTAPYIASQFGAYGRGGYASLLDALFSLDGSYRYAVQQASTRSEFDRTPASFKRQSDSLLLTGPSPGSLVPSGGATSVGDFLALVDTDTGNGDISVTYLQPELAGAGQGLFSGTYYCGHVLTNGQSLFFRATMNGRGQGSLIIIRDRQGRVDQQAQIRYEVSEDGTTTFDYGGVRLAGSLSADGSVFAATQVSSSAQGAGICIRASTTNRLSNLIGKYYGAWFSTRPVAGVTELVLDNKGQTVEAVLRDSVGGRNYSLGTNFILALSTGQLETRDADGAVSADGRLMFLIQTDPNKFPTLIVYVRQT